MTTAHALRIRRVSDAVVSAYLREISTPAATSDAPEPARVRDARVDRPTSSRRALRRRRDLADARRAGHAARRAPATTPHHRAA